MKRFMHIALAIAWVLWIKYESIGPAAKDGLYGCSWVPESAYPTANYSQCLEDMKTLANRKATIKKEEKFVKTKKLDELVGSRLHLTIELKGGGTFYNTFVCFPENINPRAKGCE